MLLLLSPLAHANPFSPVQAAQVPSGLSYNVSQPPVADAQLFAGKRVAILASHGVEETELVYPYEYLSRRGATVEVLVPEWAKDGVVAVQFLKPSLFVKGNGTFKEGRAKAYDLVVLTGGAWNAQVVRNDGEALGLVREHVKAGRPLAAICAGTTVLIDAGLAEGLRMTSSPAVVTDVKNAGARYEYKALVIDGKIATSRSPNDLAEFVEGLRQLLGK